MPGKRIGYKRVSSTDQNPERQLEGIALDKVFIEYASARNANRPVLQSMLEYARDDDIIFVHSMDRLARSVFDLRKLVNEIISRKIQIRFIKENLTFTGKDDPMSDLLLSMIGAIAEFELAFIRERQREGIEIAKRNGKFKGRARVEVSKEQYEMLDELLKTRMTIKNISEKIGIKRGTLYNLIKEKYGNGFLQKNIGRASDNVPKAANS